MIRTVYNEYRDIINSNKRWTIVYAIICFFRMPHFRVVVLIKEMLNCKCKIKKNILRQHLCVKYGIEIGKNVRIGKYFKIKHINGIVIGENVIIGENVTLYHGVTIGQRKGYYPVIEDNVTIYPNSIILGNIKISNNSIILANSVVINSVETNTMVAGNPATVIKK